MSTLNSELDRFYVDHKFNSKGKLSVALVITEHAKKRGLPLDAELLLTEGGGQVYGLGKGAVQSILARHGIDKVLAQEGGRTSRGSIGNMREYVGFLNTFSENELEVIERFWIEKVKIFFSGKPLKIRLDNSQSLRSMIRDLIQQAESRQKDSQGVYYVGAILQHLVGAKLDCALGIGHFSHNSFSTSDAQTGRNGDFFIGNVALHVTTSPTESIISRCQDNLERGHRPIIVTTKRGITLAEGLAENANLAARIDVFEIEQFIALNLYEFAKFDERGRTIAVSDLVGKYNEIVMQFETDPSLLIELQ
ncbi:DUF4928 family protein [Mucilaginibacter rubeus]|uniref:DUF4928 domain-containing protein n=1 Tax=Mucilaginibacter rubeus TaxID=2027860 RepID=A0A5C1I7Q0_9SPHI|nr:DUF4928 family protein [Mucilaginibacter rubeus]QEM13410.1 DUF4928 domain-containing protein [Mucilaginibacter rubeus]